MKKVFVYIAAMLISLSPLMADNETGSRVDEPQDSTVTENFAIFYRFDDTKFDPTYLTNGETAAHIRNYLQNSPRIDSIKIYAWASPEGAYHHNVWLSKERAKTAKRFLLDHSPDSARLDSKKIHISPLAENWPGLLKIVEEKYFRHDREKVLKILRTQGIGDETRKWRLQQLDKGHTWKYLRIRYMPQLRSATWICVWAEVADPLPEVAMMQASAVIAEKPLPEKHIELIELAEIFDEEPVRIKEQQLVLAQAPYAALRSNLLVPGLNVGLEIPIGNNWSFSTDYYYPWFWPKEENRNCFEFIGLSAEGRYWFGKNRKPQDRLRGHSVGVYAAGGYYDFERDYEGLQGEFISAGFDYTYAVGLGHRKNVNLEFTLALGYIHSWNKTYTVPGPEGPLYPDEGVMMFDYFGPTKAAVSIVIPLKEKEGRR